MSFTRVDKVKFNNVGNEDNNYGSSIPSFDELLQSGSIFDAKFKPEAKNDSNNTKEDNNDSGSKSLWQKITTALSDSANALVDAGDANANTQETSGVAKDFTGKLNDVSKQSAKTIDDVGSKVKLSQKNINKETKTAEDTADQIKQIVADTQRDDTQNDNAPSGAADPTGAGKRSAFTLTLAGELSTQSAKDGNDDGDDTTLLTPDTEAPTTDPEDDTDDTVPPSDTDTPAPSESPEPDSSANKPSEANKINSLMTKLTLSTEKIQTESAKAAKDVNVANNKAKETTEVVTQTTTEQEEANKTLVAAQTTSNVVGVANTTCQGASLSAKGAAMAASAAGNAPLAGTFGAYAAKTGVAASYTGVAKGTVDTGIAVSQGDWTGAATAAVTAAASGIGSSKLGQMNEEQLKVVAEARNNGSTLKEAINLAKNVK